MLQRLKKLREDCSGATSIEYALIGSSIAVAIIVCLTLLGPALRDTFDRTIALFPG